MALSAGPFKTNSPTFQAIAFTHSREAESAAADASDAVPESFAASAVILAHCAASRAPRAICPTAIQPRSVKSTAITFPASFPIASACCSAGKAITLSQAFAIAPHTTLPVPERPFSATKSQTCFIWASILFLYSGLLPIQLSPYL